MARVKQLLYKESNYSLKNTIFFTIVVMVFFQSILFILINSLKHMKSERKEKEEKALIDRVLIEIGESFMEVESSKVDKESEIQSPSEKDRVKDRLREFVKKNAQ